MLRIHTAEHPTILVDRLTQMLTAPVDDPFTPEWIAVPSEGMRRWLRLHLSRRLGAAPGAEDGIAANIHSAFPGSLRSEILAPAGSTAIPDPWEVERLTWSILGVLEGDASQRSLLLPTAASRSTQLPSYDVRTPAPPPLSSSRSTAALAALQLVLPFQDNHALPRAQEDTEDGQRTRHPVPAGYGSARRLAELFDRYHLYRETMIRSWAQGRDVDGLGKLLPHQHRWQPELWRQVRRRVGVPSAPERLPALLDQVRSGTVALDLPSRLSLFGLTVVPGGPAFLDLARAVAAVRDVHLFVLTPSLAAQRHLVQRRSPQSATPWIRATDELTSDVSHPLLRSWGALYRETGSLLSASSPESIHEEPAPTAAPVHDEPNPTLLSTLHEDIRRDTAPCSALVPRDTDRSVQFHACYGPTRQVEVLRDVVVQLLSDDPGLREDDILVICPTLPRFAPIIEAVFGASAEARSTPTAQETVPPRLRYRIVDRSLRSTTALLAATAAFLELVGGRFETTAVLEFLALGPVRARYGFTEEELAVVNGWASETSTRWGLDTTHRRSLDLDADIPANTWQSGMDRLLLGIATAGGEFDVALGNVLPLEVIGDETDLVGRLAEALWHLGAFARQTPVPRPVTSWLHLLRQSIEALFALPASDEWQRESLTRILADIEETLPLPTGGSRPDVELSYADMQTLLSEHLARAAGRADFFRGGITITSLRPLRWVPFRVICLLGMDHGAFTAPAASNDDLTLGAPMLGDRDSSGETRQALLEAVLAASDCLVVLRDGADIRTNQEIAPSVIVSELRDAVVATVHPGARALAQERLELTHPRQAYDERCFTHGGVRKHATWGVDPRALTAARQRRGREPARRPFLAAPLPPAPRRVIELSELHRFLEHPVEMFVNEHLGVHLPRPREPLASQIPLAMDGLAHWSAGERLLRAQRAGLDAAAWERAERCRGTVPPGALGDAALARVRAQVAPLLAAADAHGVPRTAPTPQPIDLALVDGTRLVGSVLVSQAEGWSGPVHLEFSRAKPKHEVAAWLDLMALVASTPDAAWRALSIRRRATSPSAPPQAAVCDLTPCDRPADRQRAALAALAVAIDCFRRGHCEPLPLFPTFSHAVHEAWGNVKASDWIDFTGQGDGSHPATILAFGTNDMDEVLGLDALPGDPPGTGGRVERFAHYLWGAVRCSVVDESRRSSKAPRQGARSQ